MYSDFYGKYNGREYFTAEVNGDHVSGSTELAESDFRRHVSEFGLFSGGLKLEGTHVVSNAYPTYADNAYDNAAAIIAALRTLGVESMGRQGGFHYQPTARVSTLTAEAALSQR